MRRFFFYSRPEEGLTLIEVVAAMAILFIIIVSMLPMFAQSAQSNSFSKTIIDATYVAESNMETVYSVVAAEPSIDSAAAKLAGTAYQFVPTAKDCDADQCLEKDDHGHYVFIKLKSSETNADTVRVKVKVYKDDTKAVKEAQMETLVLRAK